MSKTEAAITTTNLCFRYQGNDYDSVQSVSLTVPKGKCTGLIGPNGAGKSTLISLLTGLLQPDSGSISYGQKAESEPLTAHIKKHVALVPQEYAFYPQLTIRQNLNYFHSLTRSTSDDVLPEVIGACQLQEVANKKVSTVSGGYKRRLNIAIALLKRPSIIFLDEPTVGIDPISRKLILSLLQNLKEQGTTIIYTSHLLSEVQQICDQIYGVKEARAFPIDNSQQHSPIQITWQKSVSEQNMSILSQLPYAVKRVNDTQIEIVDCDKALSLLAQLANVADNEIVEINYSKQNLDKYYLELFLQK